MNLWEAKEILELQSGYSESDIKKNYKRLIIKYHPDKSKDPHSHEKFIKIQEAYNILLCSKENDVINNIFKIFIPTFKKERQKVKVTIKEYITGVSKNIRKDCKCAQSICLNCAGSGYNIPSLTVCMECLGDGYSIDCNCYENIIIKPFENGDNIILVDENYFIKKNKLYYNFNISFKESLIGFEKTFIDPLGIKHLITVNEIIKNGDGYSIKINGNELILLFKIDYPKKLSNEVKLKISELHF